MNAFLATIPQITDDPVVDDDAARPLASRPAGSPGTNGPGTNSPGTSSPGADGTAGTAAAAFSMGRRSFLRTAVVGGGALALTMLGWVGERLPAFAVGRTSIAPGNCLGTDQPGDTPCWGADFIGTTYCASDGYHRTDSHNYGPYTDFYSWRVGCGNYAGWTWHHPNGHGHRCTDGYTREVTNATGRSFLYTSICSKYL